MKKLFPSIFFISLVILILFACSSGNTNKQNNANDSIKTTQNPNTTDNLKAAITQETNTSNKYSAYANKAKEEGFIQIQLLFDAASKATLIHVFNLTKALEKTGGKVVESNAVIEVKTTKENLEEAIKTETNKTLILYSQYIKIADKEGADDASISFNWTNDTKKKHIDMFNTALNALNNNNVKKLPYLYYVCPRCGNTFDASSVEDECSFCGTGKEKYIIFK